MNPLSKLFNDPPPTHAFELSEGGIAFAEVAEPRSASFASLEAGALVASPVHDNFQQPATVQERIRSILPENGYRKRRAALILPDYCARVTVLDFDSFPDAPEERLALVRFRLKKSVPFDVDSAVVSFIVQTSRHTSHGKVEVLAAIIADEIVTRYEGPFRALGFHPGFVTTSSLAALNLMQPDEISMLVKLGGHVLSLMVLQGSAIKLSRSVELDGDKDDEIEALLHPTVAFVEDELKARPKRIWLGGFGSRTGTLAQRWQNEFAAAVQPLQSRFGAPDAHNAGLLGYLESVAG